MSNTTIREAVGIFFDRPHLEGALVELREAGFDKEEIGLLAGERAVKDTLSDIYAKYNRTENAETSPETAFVKKESLGDTFRSLSGGLVFTGASTAMGAAVISAGVFGGAVLAAAAGAAAVAGVGALAGAVIHKNDAEYLEEQVDAGHLLIFVRVTTDEEEAKALAILNQHEGYDARVIEVKADSSG